MHARNYDVSRPSGPRDTGRRGSSGNVAIARVLSDGVEFPVLMEPFLGQGWMRHGARSILNRGRLSIAVAESSDSLDFS